MVTFSTSSRIEFPLDRYRDLTSLQDALADIPFRGGWTATAWALFFTRIMLDPYQSYGARPDSEGIPKIAVLVTDGKSNLIPIERYATDLRNSGVQVKMEASLCVCVFSSFVADGIFIISVTTHLLYYTF